LDEGAQGSPDTGRGGKRAGRWARAPRVPLRKAAQDPARPPALRTHLQCLLTSGPTRKSSRRFSERTG